MKKKNFPTPTALRWVALGIALIISFATCPMVRADGMNPDADKILQAMSSYLGETKSFTANADIDLEIITQMGQKLQLSSFSTLNVERPSTFFITRKGLIANACFIFDGKTLTLQGKDLNIYSQTEIDGTIEDAIMAYELQTGLPAPGADLLFSDSYTALSDGVQSSSYLGSTYINGIECHHLAFREAKVDWQLWVATGDKPLPMKYVITTKWHTGAPQYEIRLRDWDLNPKTASDHFSFSIPEGAVKLETIPVNETGEFTSPQEGS